MNVLIIGKPQIDVTLIIDEYPSEGTTNLVKEREIIPGGISLYVAIMLANWGVKVAYTGVIGGEEEGLKVKSILENNRLESKYIEINYEVKTDKNYSVLSNTGKRTNIMYNNEKYLSKYRFDFDPDYIITDGSDIPGALGVINNYPNAKVIMLAKELTKNHYNLTKKCSYVVASGKFASAAVKLPINYKKSKTLVELIQKLQDLENAKYTINLEDHGTLYVKDRQVKYIAKIESNLRDEYMREAAFFGAFCYGILNNLDIDSVSKISNMAYYKAGENIGNINNILKKEDMFALSGATEVKEEPAKKEVAVTETLSASNQETNDINEENHKEGENE